MAEDDDVPDNDAPDWKSIDLLKDEDAEPTRKLFENPPYPEHWSKESILR